MLFGPVAHRAHDSQRVRVRLVSRFIASTNAAEPDAGLESRASVVIGGPSLSGFACVGFIARDRSAFR